MRPLGERDPAASQVRRAADAVARGWGRRHLELATIQEGAASQLGAADLDTYTRRYMRPLVELLVGYVETGDPAYADVYRDERQRFGLNGELPELLAVDEAELLAAVGSDGRDALAGTLAELHRPLVEPGIGRTLRGAFVGDCLFNELRAFLVSRCRANGLDLATWHFYFSAIVGGLSPDEVVAHLRRVPADFVALSFLTFEGIPPYQALLRSADRIGSRAGEREVDALVGIVRRYVESLREVSGALFLIHGASGLPLSGVRRRVRVLPPMSRARRRVLALLNDRMEELAANTENALFVDEREAVRGRDVRAEGEPLFSSTIGREAVFHTRRFGRTLADTYLPKLMAYANLSRTKVLLVDFDNTLWRGVMAEGPVEHDFRAQRLLAELKQAGILLVALSKNDPSAIRWDELALSRDDFVLHKVSWAQKVTSIEEAAHQLDLAMNTFVLIDDNPVERALVERELPDVLALDPADAATWDALELMLDFPNTRQTDEAARRTEMYREAAARREALAGTHDYGAMMGSLGLEVTVAAADESTLDRVHELVQRTTQFNTTTRRRSPAELAELLADPAYDCRITSLRDRFGDLGVVGVVIAHREGTRLTFDSVIMSCRAMGFGLELAMIASALEAAGDWETAVGVYAPTDRNGPCAQVFANAGFAAMSPEEWLLTRDAASPVPVPEWLDVRVRDPSR